MDFRELFLSQHARAHAVEVGGGNPSTQDQMLDGVTEEQMRQRPQPGFNSLAWLFWHMSRTEDIGINLIIAERPQVWDEGGWADRLNVSSRELGAGMTDPEVDDFIERINVAELLAYRVAVGHRTREVVSEMRPEVLDEVISGELIERLHADGVFGANAEWVSQRWTGKQKAFTLMHSMLAHSFMHIGEGYVVRNLLGLDTF